LFRRTRRTLKLKRVQGARIVRCDECEEEEEDEEEGWGGQRRAGGPERDVCRSRRRWMVITNVRRRIGIDIGRRARGPPF